MHTYHLIGIMSGTSLDGVDLAYCKFTFNGTWKYDIIHGKTYDFAEDWTKKISSLHEAKAVDYVESDFQLGHFFGKLVNDFIEEYNLSHIDAIASHGQTILHRPDLGYTSQIGHPAAIAASTGIQTIGDFRSLDVALGGQGAPLVPIGDELLFSDYDYLINLGGISNISFKENGVRNSFDITMANMVSNHLSKELGYSYDKSGDLASKGSLDTELLYQLNKIEYLSRPAPKSLGKEYFESHFLPVIESSFISPEDKLHTFGIHLAEQIAKVINRNTNGKVLITGGGAYNNFWIQEVQKLTENEIVVPENTLVDFKEALIFAFLGALRLNEKTNTLSSVTGASRNSAGGNIYLGK